MAQQTQQFEQILYIKDINKGFIHRYLSEEYAISTLAVTVQLFDKNHVTISRTVIPLNQFYAIQTINVHRQGAGTGYGTSFGYGLRTHVNNYNWNSTSWGDIVFLRSNGPAVFVRNVQDPVNIARMAWSARKQLVNSNVTVGMGMFGN